MRIGRDVCRRFALHKSGFLDVPSMFICGRMLAYFLDNLSPFIWEIRPGFGPRWYGLAYVLAFAAGYALYRRLAERGYSQLAPEKVDAFITGVALFGVMLGGRIGHFVFYAGEDFLRD